MIDPEAQVTPVYLKEWREARSMTQRQVEHLFGWGKGHLSRLESNPNRAKPQTLSALATTYLCEVGDLFALPPPSVRARNIRPQSMGGVAGIMELHRLVILLKAEMKELKEIALPRIDALDRQLTEAGLVSENAVKNAEELAELFARFMSHMPPRPGEKS